MFTAALFIIDKIWKQPKCPLIDEQIKKMQYIYIYIYIYICSICSIYTMEYYSAIKKNEILPFVTIRTDLEGIMLSEIRQIEKDKYHYYFSYTWNLKTKTNEQT